MVVAEINGPAPAAGTIIAMCCDARVASASSILGLNEAAFGLVAPFFAMDMAKDLMGSRTAYRAIGLGTLFKGEAACSAGLVDVLSRRRWVENSADAPGGANHQGEHIPVGDAAAAARADAHAECEKWLHGPGRGDAKIQFRSETLERWHAGRQRDKDQFVHTLMLPLTQQRLGVYLDSLKARAAAGKEKKKTDSLE
jgi:enoyl-CoA hydratase/carnithine racemase